MKRLIATSAVLAMTGCGYLGDYNSQLSSNYDQSAYCCYGEQSYSQNYQGHNGYSQSTAYNYPVANVLPNHGQHNLTRNTALELSIGAEKFTGGNIVPFNTGASGTVHKVGYDNAFGTALRGSLGISHNISPRTELIGRGFYKHAKANDEAQPIFDGPGGAMITAGFDDYNSYGAELGFRRVLKDSRKMSGVNPYIGASAGFARVEKLSITNLNGNPTAITINDSDWIPTASATAGVEMSVSNQLSLGVESGLRFEGSRDTDMTPTPTSSAFSIPVSLRGRFRF